MVLRYLAAILVGLCGGAGILFIGILLTELHPNLWFKISLIFLFGIGSLYILSLIHI